MKMLRKIAVILLASLCGLMVLPSPAKAEERVVAHQFTVTTTEDLFDGVCDAHCSFKDALDVANRTPGFDEILFAVDGRFRGVTNISFPYGTVTDDLWVHGNGPERTIIEGGVFAGRLTETTMISKMVLEGIAITNVSTPISAAIEDARSIEVIDSAIYGINTRAAIKGRNIEITNSAIYGNLNNTSLFGRIVAINIWLIPHLAGETLSIKNSLIGISPEGVTSNDSLVHIMAESIPVSATIEGSFIGDIFLGHRFGDTSSVRVNNSTLPGVTLLTRGDNGGLTDMDDGVIHTIVDFSTIYDGISGRSTVRNSVFTKTTPTDSCPRSIYDWQGRNFSTVPICGTHPNLTIVPDLMLSPLQNNGGSTFTRLPLPGSPLIDAAECGGTAIDQRGVARPQGVRCDVGAVEVEQPSTLSMVVGKTPSRRTLPPSGGHIEYSVTVTNTSSADSWQTPIQVTRYTDNRFGALAPNPFSWEGDCYWWLPQLWPTQSWTCHFNTYLQGQAVGTTHTNTVSADATSSLGNPIQASGNAQVRFAEGPGVWSAASWQANLGQLATLAMPIDTNNDGTLDSTGFLIGDLNLNGKCDLYEVWWNRACMALSLEEAENLFKGDTADLRAQLNRELLASWFNIVAGNDYICAGVDVLVNLATIWLKQNPGSISTAQWQRMGWMADWARWYNETGGNNCAIDRDTASRNGGIVRSADDFTPMSRPTLFANVSPSTVAAYQLVISEDAVLRDKINALYLETVIAVMLDQPVSADYRTRLQETFEELVGRFDSDSQAEARALWSQWSLDQYVGESAEASWNRLNTPSFVPTSVTLLESTVVSLTPIFAFITFAFLLGLTVYAKKRA